MQQIRAKIAKPDIIKAFEQHPQRVFRRSDISQILSQFRDFWRLTRRETVDTFLKFLLTETKLERADFPFPRRNETRYTWGAVPLYDLLLSLKPGSYFSHYSAMHLHELTDQIPKTIYLNYEQSPKPAPTGELSQQRIDDAFRRAPRVTSNCAQFREFKICLLSGKQTGELGVIDFKGPANAAVRVTGLERTLIDITVRPHYSGGVSEVLKAYQLAHGRISVNRLTAYLRKLDYVYPYHQAIGFYLARAGIYKESQIRLLRKFPFEFDFHLAHGMKDTDYDPEWRLFFPKGL